MNKPPSGRPDPGAPRAGWTVTLAYPLGSETFWVVRRKASTPYDAIVQAVAHGVDIGLGISGGFRDIVAYDRNPDLGGLHIV